MAKKFLFDRIAFIGIGLIGSSLARACKKHGLARSLVGCARSEATRSKALELGLVERMYEDPADERRLTFAPWGTDESWDQLEVSGQAWYTIGGRLALACYYDAACLAELKVHIDTATTEYGDTDVLAMAQAAWDLSEADVQTDPVRPFTPDYVWSYRDYYEPIIEDYDEYVRAQVGL